MPFFRERALWPVLVAILGHVMMLFALAVLEVWRGTGFWAALVSVALTAGIAVWEVRIQGRPGALALSLAGTWAAAAGIVALALETGFL